MLKEQLIKLTNVKALQAFQVLRQGATILVAILLAKSTLDITGIGQYELLFYIGYTFTTFWITGFIQVFLSSYSHYGEQEKKTFFWNAYLILMGIGTLIMLFMLGGEKPIVYFLSSRSTLPYYSYFIVFIWLQIPTFLVENFYLLLNKPKPILSYGLVTFILHLSGVMLPVYWGYGLFGAIIGLVFSAVIRHLWLIVVLYQYAEYRLDKSMISKWAILALPLVLYALLGSFHGTFDNWLVSYFYKGDQQAFAIFRYGARELPLALALTSAFGMALLPDVSENLKEGLLKIKVKSRKLFHLLFPVSIVLMLSSHWWFPILFNSAFEASAIVFNVFLLITISRLIFSRTILMGLNDNTKILYISIVELLVNIMVSLVLVYFWGLAGVAMGTVIAYTFEKVALCWYLNHKYSIKVSDYTDLPWFWGYSALLLGSFVLGSILN